MSKKIEYIKHGDSYECIFNYEYKLVLYSPFIQSINEYKFMDSEEDIMYYYYGIKLLHKDTIRYVDDTPIYKWNLIAKYDTYDFPNILSFKCILEYILKSNPVENGQKYELQNGHFRYKETYETDNWAYNDYYSITKVKNTHIESSYYELYIGVSKDSQGDKNTIGFKLEPFSQKDIETLYKFVSEFIQYSVDSNNKKLKKYISLHSSNKKIIDNQIIEYSLGENCNKIDKSKIEYIFIVGDNIDIRIKDSDDKYDESTLLSLDEINQTLTIENKKKEYTFKISDVCEIFSNVIDSSTYKLYYNLDEVAQDFIEILTNKQKKEFHDSDTNSLVYKYFMSIIDRTAMCRNEHGFTDKGIDGIKPYVEKVVNKIKDILKEIDL